MSLRGRREPDHKLGAGYFTRHLDAKRETRRLITRLHAPGHQVTLPPAG